MRVLLAAATLIGFLSAPLSACNLSYVVAHGDTLTEIAAEKAGSIFATQTIYDANRHVIGDDPDLIRVGITLSLPCGTSSQSPIDWSVMPDPATLALIQKTRTVQVLDIRSPRAIAKGVIPGAISIPYSAWRGPSDNPGAPPSESKLSDIVGDAGLRLDQPIIIVHSRPTMMDSGRAAVVYWLLKSSGAENLAIMRGGFSAWSDAGLPVADMPATPESYLADVTFSSEWRADALDVYAVATGQMQGHLLDARPHSFFRRLDDAGKALETTLPAATNAPVKPLLSTLSGEINVDAGVRSVIDHLGYYQPDWQQGVTISFCDTGELSALNWFYASELAGLDDMRLYPESVRGWANDGGKLFVGAPSMNDG